MVRWMSRRATHPDQGTQRLGEMGNSPMQTGAARQTDGHTPAHQGGPYILCRDLFKIYKRADLEVVALRGIDLEVQRGELMAIVGASGSGKSTLLNILSGLDRPSAGQVQVGGRDLLDISDRELVHYRRLDVGFVWQATSRNLVPYLSVRDNIELPMAIAGTAVNERRSHALELIEALDMTDKADRLPHQLSGGEQQRVSISVAMANRPPLLLADEPTGELDTGMAVQVFDLLRRMNSMYNVTVVIVTHYPGVSQHVDRVVHIRDGRISSETHSQPSFQEAGVATTEEYLVVDRAGRLQLPQEVIEKLNLGGLATVDMEGDRVVIKSASRGPQSTPYAPAQQEHDGQPEPAPALDGREGEE